MTQSRRQWLTAAGLALAIVLLVAAAFRLWHIGSVPPGLFGDEATDGLDALDVLAGKGAIFFPANFGREGLHIWIIAGFFKLLGVSALAVRLPSVIAGILTALATLWLGVELTRSGLSWLAPDPEGDRHVLRAAGVPVTWANETSRIGTEAPGPVRTKLRLAGFAPLALGLIAALYLSTSYFHVHFSRFGIRGVFTPLCGALAFAAFWHGVNTPVNTQAPRRKTYLWFAASGVFLGLSLHFYTASRFLPVFLAGFLGLQAIISVARGCPREAILVRNFGAVVALFGMTALIFAPLGLYFIQHPGSFMQRASEVSAFKDGTGAWPRMGQAALANVLQFFLPGAGDTEQFYNLPGRPVFDPLTALLAVAGIAVLLWRWKQPAALFLLTWWPALLVPSFLATDRFPTLPRVLGTLPGVYFFPAAALLAGAGLWQRRRTHRVADETRSAGAGAPRRVESAVLLAPAVAIAAVLLVHAGSTYHDYFSNWGTARETYDAFETDMTQAVELLAPRPAAHVYLSSDIYRHPTFMLLGQKVAVSHYFDAGDPNLSWFDDRTALPLPPAGQPATYVIPLNMVAEPHITTFLFNAGARRIRPLPSGTPEMSVASDLPAAALLPQPDRSPEAFTDRLSLIGAAWDGGSPATATLRLFWQTSGADAAGWRGYRMQVEGQSADGTNWQVETPFDDFRPPEWTPGGRFMIWRELQVPGGAKAAPPRLRLRLIDVASGRPLLAPGSEVDGWHTVAVNGQ